MTRLQSVRRAVQPLGTFVVTAVLLVIVWMVFLRIVDVGSYIGKTPADVWNYLFDAEKGVERRSELLDATSITFRQAVIGFLAGTVIACAVAVCFVLSRSLERAVMPIALALRSVPIVAMIPLLAYLFGRDVLGSIIIVSIIVWFPTLVLVTFGLRAVSSEQVDLMKAYDASSWQLLRRVRVPAALPSLFAAAKIGAPAAILGALINGWLSTGDGLGDLMLRSTTSSNYNRLWAGVVIVTFLSMILAAVISAFENLALARFAPDRLTAR
jgi:ABC-type nitrate/sulfonate/bicarbonate transport system permease component